MSMLCGGEEKQFSASLHFFSCLVLLIMFSCVICPSAFANEASEEGNAQEEVVEEMVVTASRRPTSLRNAPAVVSVITDEDIARLPHRNLAELLLTQAGININQPQGQGVATPQGFAMRGVGGTERTLLLVDGQEWNSGFTSYFYMSKVPVEAIERIEVVRGPFSSLYGGRAMAGVIHIFTKDGWDGPGEVSGGFKAGDFSRRENYQAITLAGDTVSLAASRSDYETGNYYLNDDEISRADTTNRGHEHDRMHAHSRLLLHDDLTVHVSGGRFQSRTGYGIGTAFGTKNTMDTERQYMNARAEYSALTDWDAFGGINYIEDNHDYLGEAYVRTNAFPAIPVFEQTRNKSGYEKLHGNLGAHWHGLEDHTLTFGLDADRNEGSKKVVGIDDGEVVQVGNREGSETDKVESTISAYVQDDWFILPEVLELVTGLRFDHYDGFGDQWSPKAALIWHYWTDGRVKLSGGKSFRPPDLNDRFTPPWSMGPTRTRVANPDLKPEEAWSYELALENEWLDGDVTTRVASYYSKITDYIESVTESDPLSAGRTISFSDNVGRVEAKGVETEIGWTPLDGLKLFANHQYNETRDMTAENDAIMDGHPMHRANVSATWYSRHFDDFLGVSAGVGWHFIGQQKYTAFRSGNTGKVNKYEYTDASFGLDFWQRRLRLFAEVFNLFDKETHRTDMTDYLPERNYLAGAEVRFEF